MVERADWRGFLHGRRSGAELSLVAPLQQGTHGGSGAFLARASDERRYWIKTLNNPQSPRVPITEQIVARAGKLIGAPTCEVKTIGIGATHVGWEFRPGRPLEEGIAHGSLACENVTETRRLQHRTEDDNAERHACIMELYNWCWGNDAQWLLELGDENGYRSHDHGHFLPGGPNWTVQSLEAQVDEPHEYADEWQGISEDTARGVAERLAAVRREDIASALREVPREWPVTDAELEMVGFFLERRAAQRIRGRFGG